MDDEDPSLLFDEYITEPCHLVDLLPLTYDNRLDKIIHRVYRVSWMVCTEGRIDLVEKLLNGGYIAVRYVPRMLNYYFLNHEFIYRDRYMKLALTYRCHENIIGILDRKRDRQHAVITMSSLADRYRTNVYVHLTSVVESLL